MPCSHVCPTASVCSLWHHQKSLRPELPQFLRVSFHQVPLPPKTCTMHTLDMETVLSHTWDLELVILVWEHRFCPLKEILFWDDLFSLESLSHRSFPVTHGGTWLSKESWSNSGEKRKKKSHSSYDRFPFLSGSGLPGALSAPIITHNASPPGLFLTQQEDEAHTVSHRWLV